MNPPFDPQRGLVIVAAELWGASGSAVLRLALDTGATSTADSPAEQEPQHRRQHLFRLPGEFVLAGTGHRMGDQGEGVVRRAVGLGDGLPVRHEEFGADGRGRDATPLQEDAVEHTAR